MNGPDVDAESTRKWIPFEFRSDTVTRCRLLFDRGIWGNDEVRITLTKRDVLRAA